VDKIFFQQAMALNEEARWQAMLDSAGHLRSMDAHCAVVKTCENLARECYTIFFDDDTSVLHGATMDDWVSAITVTEWWWGSRRN
jgi:hypothetical protein